jgi:DNA-binding CsgD family transcriptional regulator
MVGNVTNVNDTDLSVVYSAEVVAAPVETSKPSRSSLAVPAADLLEALSADVVRILEAVQVPAYIVDCQRRIRWQNAASIELVGDLRGRLDSSVGLDPDGLGRAKEAFARKLNGASQTTLEVSVARRDGTRVRVAVNSVPLTDADGVMIGSFGLVQVLGAIEPSLESAPSLSQRERETLTLLAAGYSTAQMAQHMRVSKETVRNHVKRMLRRLGARSRVEAVAKGRRAGLI